MQRQHRHLRENARDAAETALASSGAALAFNDLWSGDIDITTSSQWKALGTEAVPSNATWLIWNGGKASSGDNDGPAGLTTWINAATWRALTADTVDTTPDDGTGMLMVDWIATDIGDGTPDFARRDAIIGRTLDDIPLITSTNTGEDFYGASLKYITQSVSTPGGVGTVDGVITGIAIANDGTVTVERSVGIDLTADFATAINALIAAAGGGGGLSQAQVDARVTALVATYALMTGSIGVSDLPSAVQNAVRSLSYSTANPQRLSYAEIDGGTSSITLSGLAALNGATFTGAVSGITPTADAHLSRKDYVDSADALRALLTGATFTGAVLGVTPTANAHLSRKDYVDTADNLRALLAGATFTGAVKGPTPVVNADLTTKAYVDGLIITPTHTTDQYLGVRADTSFVATDFTGVNGEAYASNSHTAIVPNTGLTVAYLAIARLATDPDLVYIDINGSGVNSLGGFTKQAATLTINSDTYELWVSENTGTWDGLMIQAR